MPNYLVLKPETINIAATATNNEALAGSGTALASIPLAAPPPTVMPKFARQRA
jgi:hypothetical protein